VRNGIIKTILYFDIFTYPLTEAELYQHHGSNLSIEAFRNILHELVNEGLLKTREDFYFSPHTDEEALKKRLNGNRMAAEMMPVARKWSKIIHSFPFVRSVNLSGSLSKNYYDKHSDIDYFIITKTNRLWICRTLLSICWKLLSAKNKKNFCTNYFVDETVLEMGDKNQFVAIELSYLLPIINGDAAQTLLSSNEWVKKYVENKTLNREFETDAPRFKLKTIFEKLLDNKFGDMLDNYLLRITTVHWRKKYPEMAAEDFELQFRSRKNVCKRHTKGFQNKVLLKWHEKKRQYEKLHSLNLS
jgi:hypothetical protein